MNQKILIAIIIVLLGAVGFLLFKPQGANGPDIDMELNNPKEDNTADKQNEESVDDIDIANIEGEIVYYYGATCPHCLDVNEFLEENDIASKVEFAKKEVWNNKENASELSEAAQKCGINPGSIGVPFVFADGKCYIGGPKVKGFFKKAAGL